MWKRAWMVIWASNLALIFVQPRMGTQIPSFDVSPVSVPGGYSVARVDAQPQDAQLFRILGVDRGIGEDAPDKVFVQGNRSIASQVGLRQEHPTADGGEIDLETFSWAGVASVATLPFFLGVFGYFVVAGLGLYSMRHLPLREVTILGGWKTALGVACLGPLLVGVMQGGASTHILLDNASNEQVAVQIGADVVDIPAQTRVTAKVTASYQTHRIVTKKPDGTILDDLSVRLEPDWLNILNIGRANSYELRSTLYVK